MSTKRFVSIGRLALVVGATLTMSITSFAQSTTGGANSFVVQNARIFDGKQVIPSGDVWVENGTIKAVGPHLQIPKGTKEVDGTGDTLLPGLIDSHTHTWGDALKKALAFGVTTELDMFTDIGYVQQVKQEEAAGKDFDMADVRSAGTLATAAGGHGTEYGYKIPTLASPDEAPAWVHDRVREGSDYIKIIYDDGGILGLHWPTLSKETMKAVIDAAHQQGKMAVVHISSQQQARDAIEAGADGLAHLFVDCAPDADFAAFVAKHHAFVVPTLTVLDGFNGTPSGQSLTTDARLTPFLSDSDIRGLKQAFPPRSASQLSEKFAEQAVAQLKDAHVPILAGTDAPNPGTGHGVSIHRELELLVRAGMTPTEALAAATSVPATVFHLDDRGEIAAGKRADLLLVKGDPTTDITATRDIVAVWKQGVQDDRAAYAAAIKKDQTAEKSKLPPTPAGSEAGLVSDFEDGKVNAKFGAGWSISTDSLIGGKSTAEMKVVEGGANGSQHSLEVSGAIADGIFAWAGAMFSPGEQAFAPANLSSKKELRFWAKGDEQTYRVMLFTEGSGRIPAEQKFTVSKEWKQFTFPLSKFNGTDGHDIEAILFTGGPTAGKFGFQIDDMYVK